MGVPAFSFINPDKNRIRSTLSITQNKHMRKNAPLVIMIPKSTAARGCMSGAELLVELLAGILTPKLRPPFLMFVGLCRGQI